MGIGCLFQPPLIALQAAMPLKDMATSTATFSLIRTLGGTIGISIGDTIYASQLRQRLPKIQGYNPSGGPAITNNVASLHQIQPVEVREQVLHAYTRSLATIWIVLVPLAFVGLIFIFTIKEYSLKRTVVQGIKESTEKPDGATEDTPAATARPSADVDEKKRPDSEVQHSESQ